LRQTNFFSSCYCQVTVHIINDFLLLPPIQHSLTQQGKTKPNQIRKVKSIVHLVPVPAQEEIIAETTQSHLKSAQDSKEKNLGAATAPFYFFPLCIEPLVYGLYKNRKKLYFEQLK